MGNDIEGHDYWVVRMGKGGAFAQWAKTNCVIGVGWNECGDVKGKTLDEAVERFKGKHPEGLTETRIRIGLNQLFKFASELEIGDIVLVPNSAERTIYIGKVDSDYYFVENPSDNCEFTHRRKVKWLTDINRDDISTELRYSVGSLLTVFSVGTYRDEINQLLGNGPTTVSRQAKRSVAQGIISHLYELDGRAFEEFVSFVLNILGLEAAATQYVGDRGVDVIGTLNAEGLANITLRVQVKRIKGSIGIEEVQRIRGTLGPDEHGAIITLSNFSKKAIEDAEDPVKKPVVLIDGETLVDMLLEHFDQLSPRYKKLLGVRPKKLKPEERFYLVG